MTHTAETPAAAPRKRSFLGSFLRGFFRLLGRVTLKLIYVTCFIAGGVFASTPVQAALAIYLIWLAYDAGWLS